MTERTRGAAATVAVILAFLSGLVLVIASMFGSFLLLIGVSDAGGGRAWGDAFFSVAIPWGVWLGCVLGARAAWRRGATAGSVVLAALPTLLMLGFSLLFLIR